MKMIGYHPNENLLIEYAAGTLPEAQALAVKTHLHYCDECAKRVERLQMLGSQLFSEHVEADETASDELFDNILARLDSVKEPVNPSKTSLKGELNKSEANRDLPDVLGKLIPKPSLVKWKTVSKGLKSAALRLGQGSHQVSLHKISAGNKVVHHDHRREEITVVLRGSFSDETGVYKAGDFVYREPGQTHRPMASLNEDCLCLSVEAAPIKITGWLGYLLNPFMRFRPI